MVFPSYEQLELELSPFRDETGYLSLQKRNEYLVSKGVARVEKNDLILLQNSSTGEIPCVEYMNLISNLNSKKKYKLLGKMGINKVKEIVKDKITADEIDF